MRPLSFCGRHLSHADLSLSPFPRAHANIRNALLLRRTKVAIGAKRTVEAGLRLEYSIGNAACGLFDAQGRFLQLACTARGGDVDVLLQVVKDQSLDLVIPFFLRRHGVDGKLQTLVGVLLISRTAGLVVDYSYAAIGAAVDAVDASGDNGFSHTNIEPFFRVQNLRRNARASRGQEFLQLLQALLLI